MFMGEKDHGRTSGFYLHSMNDHASSQPQSQMEKHGKSEEKTLYFCEVCEFPCATEFELKEHFKEENHTKKERDLMYGGFKVEELERIIKKVKCLKDYVDEPEREPLIGLECVVEFTSPGAAGPEYQCEICESKSKLVPMIVHLNGLKHRKAYISKYFPLTAKARDPKEDIFQFLRRMALEIERYRGLKMFRIESNMEQEPANSLSHDPSPGIKRSKWESDYESEDPVKKIEQDNRFDEILSKSKPLNPIVANAVQRAKDRAAALQSNGGNPDAGPVAVQKDFGTGDHVKRENERSNQKNDPESQEKKNIGLKYSTLWGEDEWKNFFRGRSSAEKAAWLETFQKNQPTHKGTSDSVHWMQASSRIQASSQKKEQAASELLKETERRAEAEKRERRKAAERRERRADAERRAEIERHAENERRKRRAEAERCTLADYIAKAKSATGSLTESKTDTVHNQQGYVYIESNSTIVKVDEEKLAQAKRVAERITKMNPNILKTPVPSFIGKLRAFQNKPIHSAKGSDPSVKQAIAEKLAQTNRSQTGGENGKGDMKQESYKHLNRHDSSVLKWKPLNLQQAHTVPAPVTAPSLSDESVVRLLENFLQESIGEDEAVSVPEDAVSWNQELLLRNQPSQFVSASGRSWNSLSINEQPEIAQALGTAYPVLNRPFQRVKNSPFYDVPSSLQNPLHFQTMEESPAIFKSQKHNSVRMLSLRESCALGNLTGADSRFVSDYNGADRRSYSNVCCDGPSSYGTDYQNSSLYRNVSGASSNRTSDSDSIDWYNLPSTSSTLHGFPGNRRYSNYSGESPNKLQGYADRGTCPSLGGSYRDRFGEMAQSRTTTQKSTFHHW